MPNGGDRRPLFGLSAATLVAADLATKSLIERGFATGEARALAGDWLQLRLVYNPGAAFGFTLGPHSRWIFVAIAAGALVLLWQLARRADPGDWFRHLALGLLAGGAAGNLVDRLRSGAGVVDFLDVGVGTLRWPTFNVADVGVTCGAILLAVSLWVEDARRSRAQPSSVS